MSDQITFKQKINTLMMVHYSLVIVLVMMSLLVLFIGPDMSESGNYDEALLDILIYAPAALLLIAFLVSGIVFKNLITKDSRAQSSLENKVASFQNAHIVRMALYEVPGLAAIVLAMLTNNHYLLIIVAAVIGMFVLMQPNADRIANDMNLSPEERNELEKG